jgi:hypothetical protein
LAEAELAARRDLGRPLGEGRMARRARLGDGRRVHGERSGGGGAQRLGTPPARGLVQREMRGERAGARTAPITLSPDGGDTR